MQLNKIVEATKTLRFRLTLIYSLILFIFTSSFVLVINIYLNDYFNRDFQEQTIIRIRRVTLNPIQQFNEEQRQKIMEIRQKDLKNIQTISIYSLFPISLLSFLIGYSVSGTFLSPLKILNSQISTLNDKKLGTQINEVSDDEIGDLIKNFNAMSKRLKQSFDDQNEFIENASHELKTPLAVIQTSLDSALMNPNCSKTEMRKAIQNALIGTSRARKLTETLLDLSFSKQMVKEKTNIVELIKTVISLLEPLYKKSMVKVVFETNRKEIFLNVDKIMFSRAISNLVENGIKYCTGTTNAQVIVKAFENKKNVRISVLDNGVGIPKKYQSQIFKRFFRVDKSRSRKTGGFGLGLAISKKIVEQHNGKISFSSQPGKTEFVIEMNY